MSLAQVALLDKLTGILASKDPLAFQAIQAMNGVIQYDDDYSPSEEAEARRIRLRDGEEQNPEEDMNEQELAFLSDIQPGLPGTGY